MIISLDIWDTVLRRKVHPDLIKRFTQQRLALIDEETHRHARKNLLVSRQTTEARIAQESQKNGFDDEYTYQEVLEKSTKLTPLEIIEQVEFECAIEIENTYADPEILNYVDELKDGLPARIKAISDFYLGAEHLEKIIQSNFQEKIFESSEIEVSCDWKFNKRGKLFEKVLTKEGSQNTSDWFHVGDSHLSDVISAQNHGLKAFHYLPVDETAKREKLFLEFQKREKGDLEFTKKWTDELSLAVGLIGFSEELRGLAIRERREIHFLEREGAVLQDIFMAACDENVYSLPKVEQGMLSVSRRALAGAAAHLDLYGVLDIIMFSYPSLSGRRLLASFGVDPTLNFVGLDEPVQEFLSNTDNLNILEPILKNKYDSTMSYLSRTLEQNASILLADVGWMGTMQEYISILRPDLDVKGFYLGLQGYSRVNLNGRALGYISNESKQGKKILTTQRPVELIFMPKGVSGVIGYDQDGNVLRNKWSSGKETPQAFMELQKRILDSVSDAAAEIRRNLLLVEECSQIFTLNLSKNLTRPTLRLVTSYLSAQHDETFGVGSVVETGSKLIYKRLITSLITLDFATLFEVLGTSGWPEATFFRIFGFRPGRFSRYLLSIPIAVKTNIQKLITFPRKAKYLLQTLGRNLKQNLPAGIAAIRREGLTRTVRRTISYLEFVLSEGTKSNNSQNTVIDWLAPKYIYIYDDSQAANIGISKKIIDRAMSQHDALMLNSRQFLNTSIFENRLRKVFVDSTLTIKNVVDVKHKFPRSEVIRISKEDEITFIEEEGEIEGLEIKNSPRAAWIIPTLPIASGGHRGMLRIGIELAKFGIEPVFYVIHDSGNVEEIKTRFKNHYYDVEVEIRAGLPEQFDEEIVVATAHYTLGMARLRLKKNAKLFYFVQDDEALFNPVSSTYFFARETYRQLDANIIASGAWMSSRIEELTGRKVPFFKFPVDKKIYYPRTDTDRARRVIFYFKPEAERRLAQVGLKVLEIVKNFLPDVEIVLFGSHELPETPFEYTSKGQFETIEEMADLYRSSSIGLVFSPTNPSLIPYEMAACGLPVVDYIDTGDQAKMAFIDETGIVSSDASTLNLAMVIVNLLTDPEAMSKASENMILKSRSFATPEESGHQAAQVFLKSISQL